MKLLTFLIAALSLTFFYSCTPNKGTSTGNPLVSINMTGSAGNATTKNFKPWFMNTAYAFTPPASMNDAVSNTVSLSEFWINFGEIELKPDETASVSEVDGDSVEFAGPYLVNLFSNSTTSIASGPISQSSIRRIKYKTKKVSGVSGGNPAQMDGNCIYMAGTVSGTSFSLLMDQEIEFESSGPNLVTFSTNDNLLMQIQTAELIRKIDLSVIQPGDVISNATKINAPSACPTIDASANTLYDCFVKGIQQQTKVGKDINGDDDFDSEDETVN